MARGGELDTLIGSVQTQLAALGDALRRNDAEALADAAARLQPALLQLRRAGALPPAGRQQLSGLAAQLAAQHEALARAGAALTRSADTLLPANPALAGYAADGLQTRTNRSGWASA